jgi:sulfoxide reductase heme-binding subunit YedZ
MLTRWNVLRYALHATLLVPLALLVLGAFGIAGQTLGADPVETLLRELGWWAVTLLVAGLAVSPLRQWLKQAPLLRLRRPLGLWAFTYAMLHFAVYLLLDRQLAWGEVLNDLSKRPYIMVGFAAVLLLLPLAATSTAWAMRKLGRRWQKLHRLAYATAILGVLHFLLQVKKDLSEPLLYAAALAALFGWRVWHHTKRRQQS